VRDVGTVGDGKSVRDRQRKEGAMKSCKVIYPRNAQKKWAQAFEKDLDALMEKYNMERWASGYEIETGLRDIAYEKRLWRHAKDNGLENCNSTKGEGDEDS